MSPYGNTETDHSPPPPYGGAQGAAHQFARDLEKARYESDNEVGVGGMGRVIVAREVPLRRVVAMKLLRDDRQSEAMEARLIREARITGILEHPSIVPVHDLGKNESGEIFFTMKKVEGLTLAEIIEKLKPATGEATPEDNAARADIKTRFGSIGARLEIIQKVCDAISFAHAHELRVIHRDLKPENIMVGRFGEVLVMDWGLAKVLGNKALLGDLPEEEALPDVASPAVMELTQMGSFLGSWLYAPPEQIEGRLDDIDERSDVYALGCVLYQLLTLDSPLALEEEWSASNAAHSFVDAKAVVLGHITTRRTAPLLRGTPRQKKLTDIPQALADLILPALEAEPKKRIQSISAIKQAMGQHLSGFAHDFENAGVWAHFRYFVKRHKGVSIATAVTVSIATAAIVLTTFLLARAEASTIRARASEDLAWSAKKSNNDLQWNNSYADSSAARRAIQTGRRAEGIAYLERSLQYRPQFNDALADSANETLGLNAPAWQMRSVIGAPLSHDAPAIFKPCCVSPNGKLVAAAFRPDRHLSAISVYDLATGTRISTMQIGGAVTDLRFSPDSLFVVVAAADYHCAIVIEAATGNYVQKGGLDAQPTCIDISPHGDYLAVGSQDHTARVIEAKSGAELFKIALHGPLRSVNFSSTGSLLALAGFDSSVYLCDVKTRKIIFKKTLTQAAHGWSNFARFSPDEQLLSVVTDDNKLDLVEIPSGTIQWSTQSFSFGLNPNVQPLFSGDGRLLAVAIEQGKKGGAVVILDARSGAVLCQAKLGLEVTSIDFSPDGRLLASGSIDGLVTVLDATTCEEVCKTELNEEIGAVAFSKDGRFLVAASADTLNILEVSVGRKMNTFTSDPHWRRVDEDASAGWLAFLRLQARRQFKKSGWDWNLGAADFHSEQEAIRLFANLEAVLGAVWQQSIVKWWMRLPDKRTTSPWTEDLVRLVIGQRLMAAKAFTSDGTSTTDISDCADQAPWHPLEPLSLARTEPAKDRHGNLRPRADYIVRPRFLARLTLKRLKQADEALYGRDTLAQYAEWSAKIMHEELHLDAEALEAIDFAIERTPKEKQQPLLDLKAQFK